MTKIHGSNSDKKYSKRIFFQFNFHDIFGPYLPFSWVLSISDKRAVENNDRKHDHVGTSWTPASEKHNKKF